MRTTSLPVRGLIVSRPPLWRRPTTVNPLSLHPVISSILAAMQGSLRSARHAAATEARRGPALGRIPTFRAVALSLTGAPAPLRLDLGARLRRPT